MVQHPKKNTAVPSQASRYFIPCLSTIYMPLAVSTIRGVVLGKRVAKHWHTTWLATGSSNLPTSVNANDPKLVEAMAKIMLERNSKPEIEVFDSAMIGNALELLKKQL